MPNNKHDTQERELSVTVEHKIIGEVEGWPQRQAAVEKVLCNLVVDPVEAGDFIPMSFVIPDIARDLARYWETKHRKSLIDRHIIKTVEKIKKLSKSLVDDDNNNPHKTKIYNSTLSFEMLLALHKVARAPIYTKSRMPTRGRTANSGAMNLAHTFAHHYIALTGRQPGVNADHDFVMTLGELFEALGFKARPQHYAKQAVEALEREREIAAQLQQDMEAQAKAGLAP